MWYIYKYNNVKKICNQSQPATLPSDYSCGIFGTGFSKRHPCSCATSYPRSHTLLWLNLGCALGVGELPLVDAGDGGRVGQHVRKEDAGFPEACNDCWCWGMRSERDGAVNVDALDISGSTGGEDDGVARPMYLRGTVIGGERVCVCACDVVAIWMLTALDLRLSASK